jgi:hypothetical protein
MLGATFYTRSGTKKLRLPHKREKLVQIEIKVRLGNARWFVFKPKIRILGKFRRVLQWKRMVYFMDSWSILRSFVIFYGHFVKFVVIWYIFPILVFCNKKNLATLRLGQHVSRTSIKHVQQQWQQHVHGKYIGMSRIQCSGKVVPTENFWPTHF